VPGTSCEDVKLLEYDDHLKIYRNRKELACYRLPPFGVKNERISPEGLPEPVYAPRKREKPKREEEFLRSQGPAVSEYLDLIDNTKGIQKSRLIRDLYALCKRLAPKLFAKAIERAQRHKVTDFKSIENIAALLMKEGSFDMPTADIAEEYHNRDNFKDGSLTDPPDFSKYEPYTKEDDDGSETS